MRSLILFSFVQIAISVSASAKCERKFAAVAKMVEKTFFDGSIAGKSWVVTGYKEVDLGVYKTRISGSQQFQVLNQKNDTGDFTVSMDGSEKKGQVCQIDANTVTFTPDGSTPVVRLNLTPDGVIHLQSSDGGVGTLKEEGVR